MVSGDFRFHQKIEMVTKNNVPRARATAAAAAAVKSSRKNKGAAVAAVAVAGSDPNGREKRSWTWRELRETEEGGECLVIKGKVYRVKTRAFRDFHPGGSVAWTQLGQDATSSFEGFHHPSTYTMLSQFYVGDLADPIPSTTLDRDIQKIRGEAVKRGWYEVNWLYYTLIFSIILSLIASSFLLISPALVRKVGLPTLPSLTSSLATFNLLASLMPYTSFTPFNSTTNNATTLSQLANESESTSFLALTISSLLLGLAFQQLGWLAHDCCHHQLFSKTVGERRGWWGGSGLAAYFVGDFMQGFSIGWWKEKHCTHHAAPNIHAVDPDIDTMPFLAWSEHIFEELTHPSAKKELKDSFMVKYQAILIFPLLAFARLAWAFGSIIWNLKGEKTLAEEEKEMTFFPAHTKLEQTLLFLHYVWYVGGGLVCLNFDVGKTLLWALLVQVWCGIFLSSVFSLNHNGMPVFTSEEAANMNFYELAIRTGRNITPSLFNDWFTGGLNYQIEHHMFPSMPRHNLPLLSDMVQALCKKHSIPYHSTGFVKGMSEIVGRLTEVSRSDDIRKIE